MRVKGYTKLVVWQKADHLARQIYTITKNFPQHERYGLTSQLRRAAISIPTNLVEGSGRQGKNETKQFANIALGSLAETEYLMGFCRELNLISTNDYVQLDVLCDEVNALLWSFYKSF
jgi:four helix bundle protein